MDILKVISLVPTLYAVQLRTLCSAGLAAAFLLARMVSGSGKSNKVINLKIVGVP